MRREAPREQELQLGAGIFIVWQVGGIQLIMKNLHHTLLVYAGFILKINVTIAGQMGWQQLRGSGWAYLFLAWPAIIIEKIQIRAKASYTPTEVLQTQSTGASRVNSSKRCFKNRDQEELCLEGQGPLTASSGAKNSIQETSI